jgi:hypothetical protein
MNPKPSLLKLYYELIIDLYDGIVPDVHVLTDYIHVSNIKSRILVCELRFHYGYNKNNQKTLTITDQRTLTTTFIID